MLTDEEVERICRDKEQYWEVCEQVEKEIIRAAYRRKVLADFAVGKEYGGLLGMAVQRIGREYFVKPRPKSVAYFVTIGAKDGIDAQAFWRQMEKVRAKKVLHGTGVYVIEQRSEGDQAPYGWHIHWILRPAAHVSKSVVVQQVAQCFSKFIAGPNYVDVRPVGADEERIRAYMEGQKTEDKMAKVRKDHQLRILHGFPPQEVY